MKTHYTKNGPKCIYSALFTVMLATSTSFGGITVTIENDVFSDSDDNYSHGTEIEWSHSPEIIKDGVFRTGYGLNQLLFTPSKISDPNPPPQNDRPWAGTMSLYRETWRINQYDEQIRTRFEIGVLGPSSHADYSQKKVHEWLDCKTPMGWHHQMPDEPMVNVYQDRYAKLSEWVVANKTGFDWTAIYGGTLGTTYVNARGGLMARFGYNLPVQAGIGDISPKNDEPLKSRVFLYSFAEITGVLVAHNATLSNSMFRDRETGQERDIEHFLDVYRYGVAAGWDSFRLSYQWEDRGEEFEGETDGGMSYGILKIEFTTVF